MTIAKPAAGRLLCVGLTTVDVVALAVQLERFAARCTMPRWCGNVGSAGGSRVVARSEARRRNGDLRSHRPRTAGCGGIEAYSASCRCVPASAVEARYLTGQDDLHSAAQAFIDWGAAACVIKNGAEGRGWRKAWPGSKATSAVCLVCGGGAVRRGRRLASVANALQRTDRRRYSDLCSPIEDYCRRRTQMSCPRPQPCVPYENAPKPSRPRRR
jgi:hypothetical protein